ncbi:Uma2 family endonuclease [Acidithiobacillus thiooxidans]|nr:Uma2 family endonuclease [Acidithiobacillus thiooxidans]MDA8177653.1 Uma2 family endonuclease [Acidithiobacillus sp.]
MSHVRQREAHKTQGRILSNKMSVDEYLAGEQDGEFRHEYIDGMVYAMVGASRRHALIVTSLTLLLGPKARQQGCQLFTNDMKVRIQQAGEESFYYPDLILGCDPNDRETYFSTRPCLIIEVLSESTERIDRREKLYAYTGGLPSLHEYLLLAQDCRHADLYRRRSEGWQHEKLVEGSIHLDCLDMDVSIDDIYQDAERA